MVDEIKEIKGTIPTKNNKKRTLPEVKLNSLGNRSLKERFWLAFGIVFWNYVQNTQVHGFVYLRGVESQGFKRFFFIFFVRSIDYKKSISTYNAFFINIEYFGRVL